MTENPLRIGFPPSPPKVNPPMLDMHDEINKLINQISEINLDDNDTQQHPDKKQPRKSLNINEPEFTRSTNISSRGSVKNNKSHTFKKLLKLLNTDYTNVNTKEKREKLQEIASKFTELTGKPVLLFRENKRKNSISPSSSNNKKTRGGRKTKRSNKTKNRK
jgi:hypothetical protein